MMGRVYPHKHCISYSFVQFARLVAVPPVPLCFQAYGTKYLFIRSGNLSNFVVQ